MTAERDDELLDATKMGRRSMLKRVLLGGAAVYAAPVVATFALDGAGAQGDPSNLFEFPRGGNLDLPEFPRGGNLDIGDWEGHDWGEIPTNEPTAAPTAEPTPTVAPTTAPKKPKSGSKKPKSGGSAAPNFTG